MIIFCFAICPPVARPDARYASLTARRPHSGRSALLLDYSNQGGDLFFLYFFVVLIDIGVN